MYLAMGKSKAAIRDLSRVVELKQDFTSVSKAFERFLRGDEKWLCVFGIYIYIFGRVAF